MYPIRPRMNAVTLARERPRSNAVVCSPGDLTAGDILFKHASAALISRKIKEGQGTHYQDTKKALLDGAVANPEENTLLGMPSEAEATDITHVALAAGRDDVLEFDEGGAGKLQIAFGKGHGFVRGPMSLQSRKGKIYEVYRCTHAGLWEKAVDKATLVWDLTHTSPVGKDIQNKTPLTASYGVRSVWATAKHKEKGPSVSVHTRRPDGVDQSYFEKTLDEWLTAAERKKSDKSVSTNIQFFCSHFVLFCYLWAAEEVQKGTKLRGLDYLLGDRARVSPAELYTRVKSAGQAFFRYQGTLQN